MYIYISVLGPHTDPNSWFPSNMESYLRLLLTTIQTAGHLHLSSSKRSTLFGGTRMAKEIHYSILQRGKVTFIWPEVYSTASRLER